MRILLAALLVLPAAACGHGSRPGPAEQTRVNPDGSAQIIRGTDITGNLLEALRLRVQNISVIYSATGDCPRIAFRGRRAGGNPGIYIDGTLVGTTCALAGLSSNDVDRVEVYRSGTTSRPGIRSNPNGLILVYRLR